MATLIVPPLDAEPWPTLGPEVADFIEAYGIYGPGELEGKPYRITPEFRAQLYRAYEVYPKGHRLAGRRRYKQVSLEERKGTAKTERAMLVALAESHPDAPVRTDGWRKQGGAWVPVGRPMRRPYIPLVSYTVEQTEDLAYNVLRFIIENCSLAEDFDVSDERILVLDERGRAAGKVVPLAGSPNARDGALTTFQHFDEPHRMKLARLKKAFSTMRENAYKRVGADAWTLTTSTAGEPGEESVEEDIRDYAEQIDAGKVDDPRLFFFARYAPESMPLDTPEHVMEALLEASGPNAEWSGDLDALVSRYFEPKTDRAYWRRVWLNQWLSGGGSAFDVERWKSPELAKPDLVVPDGELIVIGFDGARRSDSTAMIATAVESGHQWPLGTWEPDPNDEDWEVPESEVDAALEEAFDRWHVWRAYCDPPHWNSTVDAWAGKYGQKRVVAWWTNRYKAMAYSLRAYRDAMVDGHLTHNGDPTFARHIGNARKHLLKIFDDERKPLWVIRKERPDSPRKIDAAMAGDLSWEARRDAVAAGALKRRRAKTTATFI